MNFFIMADLDWDDFRVFLEVVRHGSFNRAAAKLNMTQPTVSRRLIRLEKSIDVMLFERGGRIPRLTFDGQRIYNDATMAKSALKRATDHSDLAAAYGNPDCKIFTTDGIGGYWITRFLAPFFRRYPEIELKLFGPQDAEDKRTTFDLYVNYLEAMDADTVAFRVATTHLMPFAGRDYLRAHGTPETEEDLRHHRLLDLAAYLSYSSTWANRAHQEWSAQAALFTNLSACLVEAVRSGAGIAILPSYLALTDDTLVPLNIGLHFQAPIFVSYPRGTIEKWQVRATADFLRTTVFDRKRMPWFADNFMPPQDDWPERCAACVKQAADAVSGDRKKLQSE